MGRFHFLYLIVVLILISTSISEARWYSPATGRFLSVDPLGYAGGDVNLYRFAGNNPVNYGDPLGLWRTKDHNKIIDVAFFALPKSYRDAIKRGSRHADTYQASEYSYMHNMKDGTTNQSIENARQLMNEYIENHFLNYECKLARRNYEDAYFELGMALHPIMDSTSPAHADFQSWGGVIPLVNSGIHVSREWSINNKQIKTTVDKIKKVLRRR